MSKRSEHSSYPETDRLFQQARRHQLNPPLGSKSENWARISKEIQGSEGVGSEGGTSKGGSLVATHSKKMLLAVGLVVATGSGLLLISRSEGEPEVDQELSSFVEPSSWSKDISGRSNGNREEDGDRRGKQKQMKQSSAVPELQSVQNETLNVSGNGLTKGPLETNKKRRGKQERAACKEIRNEISFLEGVQKQLVLKKGHRALRALRHYKKKCPHPVLDTEFEALWVLALCQAGKVEAGSRARGAFLNRWPNSPQSQRVEQACP